MKVQKFTRLIGVLVIGFLIGTGITPLHAEDPNVVTGEILKICIETKTGVIRVATKCTKTERKTILGGIGAKGDKGDTGEVGFVGETGAMGPVGAIGATGLSGTNGTNGTTGATGLQGLTGATGLQGVQGFTGTTGATGSMSGVQTRTLTTWSPSSFLGSCGSFGYYALSPSTSLSTYGSSISLNKSCIAFSSSSMTVYAP